MEKLKTKLADISEMFKRSIKKTKFGPEADGMNLMTIVFINDNEHLITS